MNNLFIYGPHYLDFTKLVAAINRVNQTWDNVAFINNFGFKQIIGKLASELTLSGSTNSKLKKLAQNPNNQFISSIAGDLFTTKHTSDILLSSGCNIVNLIHPFIDMNYVKIGHGCVLPEGCVVGANTKIGDFVTVRLKSLISHDVVVQDYVFIGPGATIGGGAILKEGCFIGQGATVMGRRVIGKGSIVGAGAVVTKDVAPGAVVYGVPAREMS